MGSHVFEGRRQITHWESLFSVSVTDSMSWIGTAEKKYNLLVDFRMAPL